MYLCASERSFTVNVLAKIFMRSVSVTLSLPVAFSLLSCLCVLVLVQKQDSPGFPTFCLCTRVPDVLMVGSSKGVLLVSPCWIIVLQQFVHPGSMPRVNVSTYLWERCLPVFSLCSGLPGESPVPGLWAGFVWRWESGKFDVSQDRHDCYRNCYCPCVWVLPVSRHKHWVC